MALTNEELMNEALKEAQISVKKGGGPFGAVIVHEGKIIARGHNEVTRTNDPTSHAEIVAIREASKKLKRYSLSDCVLYSTCEPCPMCLAAMYWAKIKKAYYACTREDAAAAGFMDAHLYEFFSGQLSEDQIVMSQLNREECLPVLEKWASDPNRRRY